MSMELDVKITDKDMYRFHMYHLYHGFTGWFSILIAIIAWLAAGLTWKSVSTGYTVLYIVFGIAFLFYYPVTMKGRAKRQIAASEALRGTLHYTIDEKGIEVSFQEESALLEWKQVYKMVSTKHNVLIYSSRINAYILPMEVIGTQYEQLKQIADSHLKKYQNCMK